MIARLAVRSLSAHPIRTAVLAAGFGTGVSVMAILLGVGEIVLEQSRAPALLGGGDLVITGATGGVPAARALLGGPLRSPPLAARVRTAAPSVSRTVYLVAEQGIARVQAQGGIPSFERALDDPEVEAAISWTDSPGDVFWTAPDPASVLRALDSFHPIPDVPARADSWAEWLYFNGRSSSARFYLTFLVGPVQPSGLRVAGVRLQIDRGHGLEAFSALADLTPDAVAAAPELAIGGNHIRLDGMRYLIHLDLRDEDGRTATGDLFIEGLAGRLMPPIEVHGANGWRSGYVVPVMSGALGGSVVVDGTPVDLDGGSGYHDHNWGYWKGVSWQWGQVLHDGLSFVYGRIFPPRDAADPGRMPGFLVALGPDGPIGYATAVTITEEGSTDDGPPSRITVEGRSLSLDVTLTFTTEHAAVSQMPGPLAGEMDFLQMRGQYSVRGTAEEQVIRFDAPGSAETFRSRR